MRRLKNRYYLPSPEDSLLSRWWGMATSRRVPAFPRTVQFETHSACNAACVFCPYPATAASQPKGFMDGRLFGKIVDEMALHGVRRISPYLNNEPFLDPDMVDRLRVIRQRIPAAKIVLTTNASRLNVKTVEDLLDSCALNALYISFQGVGKEAYEATMGGSMSFERNLSSVERLIEKWRAADVRKRFKIVVTMVKTNQINVEEATAFWRAKGVESKWTPLENRGGNIAGAGALAPSDAPLKRFARCTRLFKQAYILWNGDMVLCCTDYTRKVVLGNVDETSIAEVWNSEKARAIRRLYATGRMDQIPLCKDCLICDSIGDEEFEE